MSIENPSPEKPKEFKTLDDIWKAVQKLGPKAHINTLYWLAEWTGEPYEFKGSDNEKWLSG